MSLRARLILFLVSLLFAAFSGYRYSNLNEKSSATTNDTPVPNPLARPSANSRPPATPSQVTGAPSQTTPAALSTNPQLDSILKLASCLPEKLCGDEVEQSTDTFFDPQSTRGMRELNRSLQSEIDRRNKATGAQTPLPVDTYFKILSIRSDETQILSLELWELDSHSEAESMALLRASSKLEPKAFALLYEISDAVVRQNPSLQKYRAEIVQQWLGDEHNAPETFLEKLPHLALSEKFLEKITLALCRYRTNPALEHNWPRIRGALKASADSNKFKTDPDLSCTI